MTHAHLGKRPWHSAINTEATIPNKTHAHDNLRSRVGLTLASGGFVSDASGSTVQLRSSNACVGPLDHGDDLGPSKG